MILKTKFMTRNDCYVAGRKITPKGIMVHATATPGVMAGDWFSRWNKSYKAGEISRQVCVHAFVDDKEVWQYLPWNHRGWHAGGSSNNTHIGFEICEPAGHSYKGGAMVNYDVAKNQKYFDAVWERAVKLTVFLCKEFGLTEKDVIDHAEGHKLGIASNHSDTGHWFPKHGKNMDMFRAEVAKGLKEKVVEETPLYRVQTGAFSVRENADRLQKKLEEDGFETYMVIADGLFKVQTGAFKVKANADALAAKLKAKGYETYITTKAGTPVAPTPLPPLKVGDRVRVKKGAKTYTGVGLADFVYSTTYTVSQIVGDRVVINQGKTVMAAMRSADLIKQ